MLKTTVQQELDAYKSLFKSKEKELLEEYFTYLRFPSISADPSMRKELRDCAKWLEVILSEFDFEVELWNTDDAPIIYAQNLKAGPNAPTLLIYNHYDVQPVDPVDLWTTPPFHPRKEGNNIYARGAQDNKGQSFYILTALKLYLEHAKSYPINIKLIIEGEEESGSASLFKYLKEKKEELKCDYALICDLGMRSADIPAITLGTRGLVALTVDVYGTKGDLHSGVHGGVAYNPLHATCEMLSKLRDESGKVLVPGFYDRVVLPSSSEMTKINFAFDENEYLDQFGVLPTGGEKSYSPLERLWLRPTLEINGISGGYNGPGTKTVIPAHVLAKITCRLVPNQEPLEIAQRIKNYLESIAPKGVKVSVTIHEGMGKPVRTKQDSKIIKALESACEKVWWKRPEYILEGASIPIVAMLAEETKADVALFGLGLATDCIHAPNEHFGWDRIEKGVLTTCLLISNLGEK